MKPVVLCFVILVFSSILIAPHQARADRMNMVSDLITDSAPYAEANHRIQFELINPVPAGGSIVIDLPIRVWMPPTFGIDDIDFAYATSTSATPDQFIDRTIGTSSNATTDGFLITTGSSSRLVITLAGSQGFSAGDFVQLELGTQASFQHSGNQRLTNPPSQGPYILNIESFDLGASLIDFAIAAIYIIDRVGVGPTGFTDNEPPVISNIEPALDELVQGGSDSIEFTLDTDEPAVCKYDTVASTTFAAMTFTMDDDGDFGTPPYEFISQTLTVASNTTYTFYVRCQDINTYISDEEIVRFTIGVIPVGPGPDGSVGTGGGSGGGSGSSSGGGSTSGGGSGSSSGSGSDDDDSGTESDGNGFLFQSSLIISGYSFPGSRVTILQDGVSLGTLTANSTGAFSTEIDDLERGVYTYGLYAEDETGLRSNTYTSTIALRSNTENALSGVVIPPTISVDPTEVDPGDEVRVSGYAVADSQIRVEVQSLGSITQTSLVSATTTAGADGLYALTLPTNALGIGTYRIFGVASLIDLGIDSDKSAEVLLGIGEAPDGDLCPRADINSDTAVNLTDFSIMLFNWNSTDPVSDINLSGLVELTDFSIMLFCWTG